MTDDVPVFGVCGFSGSGKTTLLEKVVPILSAKGLRVAVVKRDVHGIQLDYPGKDGDRLFSAGADMLLQSPDEAFLQMALNSDEAIENLLAKLPEDYDIILIEGHKNNSQWPKIWLLSDGETEPPAECENVIASFSREMDRSENCIKVVNGWLEKKWRETPVYACILIGGKSRRMGQPKHLLEKEGKVWLEHSVDLLSQLAERVVIVGSGQVPVQLGSYLHLPDIIEAEGPMAGMLAAMRWAPRASWLFAACDMPDISLDAIRWLLDCRATGVWGVLPALTAGRHVEPLFAHYDFRAATLLEKMVREKNYSPSCLGSHSKILTPTPPKQIAAAWRNVNTEAELHNDV